MIYLHLSVKIFPWLLIPTILPLTSQYIHTAMRLQPIRIQKT